MPALQTALLAVIVVIVGAQTLTLRSLQDRLAAFMQTVDLLNSGRPLVEETLGDIEPGAGPALGAQDAPVTIVAFSDFDCAACRQLMPKVHRIVAESSDDVRLVYRHFPLRLNGTSMERALAAECAFRQDAFWPMHDALLGDAGANVDDVTGMAQRLGLDPETFATCLDEPQTIARVKADRVTGQRYGVEGTPTLFVNGRKVAGSVPPLVLEQLIQQAGEADAA